jgi:hypothetical protein
MSLFDNFWKASDTYEFRYDIFPIVSYSWSAECITPNIIFLNNILVIEYIDNFSYSVSNCCEALHI